jgi:Gpi18-like mannosyltransferase
MLRAHRRLIILLAVALLLRLLLTPLWAYLPNGYTDEGFWKTWMLAIHQHGLLNIFRTTNTDYVGYHYVLWLLSLIYDAAGGVYGPDVLGLHLLVKAPPILFDLGLIVAVYAVALSLFREMRLARAESMALLAAGVFAVQPAVLYDSAVWSQTDSAVTLAMLLSVFLVARGRSELGFGVWAAGFLIKPHPIIVLPLLVYLAWRNGIKPFARSFAVVAGVWAVALSPWVLHGDLGRILHVYGALFGADYERLSADAWNFWWFFDLALHPKPDQVVFAFLTYRMLGLALTVSAGVLALLYLHARPTLAGALAAAAYLAFAFYLLPISTHDRYLYPFLALLLPLAIAESRWRWLYAVVSVTFFFNLTVVAPPISAFSGRWLESPFTVGVAAVNCLVFALLTLMVGRVAVPTARELARRGWSGAVRRVAQMAGEAPLPAPARGTPPEPPL